MPLVAFDEGRTRVDLGRITDDDWVALRTSGGRFLCPGCGLGMHPADNYVRKLENGNLVTYRVKMFRHNPYNAQKCQFHRMYGANESPEHERAKQLVLETVERAGWSADCEVIHDDLARSDVFMTDPLTGQKHSWEIQCSSLNVRDASSRFDRYGQYVDRQVWVTKGRRPHLERVIPTISTDDEVLTVVGGIWTNIAENEQLVEPLERVAKLWCAHRIVQTDALGDGWVHLLRRDADGDVNVTKRARNKSRRRQEQPMRIKRWCDSLDHLSPFQKDLLMELGLTLREFNADYRAAHDRVRRFGFRSLNVKQRQVLAMAGKWRAPSPATASGSWSE